MGGLFEILNIFDEVLFNSSKNSIIVFGRLCIIIGLIIILIFLLRYIRSIEFEKRFSKHTINSNKNKSISLFDSLDNDYKSFINKMSKTLNKSEVLKKNSKRYEKYRVAFTDSEDNIDFISRKIVVGFLYIVLAIIVYIVQSKLITFAEMIIPFILGYFTLDLWYLYRYSMYKKDLQNDMYDSITLMNNAFKAGMSIKQAVDLVAKELDGPISIEFKKISQELKLGLDVEVAFKRFADRVKIEEAMYLTSSLSVLNKTGGNITKVFDSIEKNIFSKRKLKQELKALTASSKLIMYVLICVPIIFVLIINFINNGYFEPLFTSPLGIILVIIMVIIYVAYIFVVRKIMDVRGIK